MAQAIPFGPGSVNDAADIMTRSTYSITTDAATTVLLSTIFNAGYCRKVFVANTTAATVNVAVRRQNDDPSVMTAYQIPAGSIYEIQGHITAVGGTGSTTGLTLVLEL